jgi:hypothetical protein
MNNESLMNIASMLFLTFYIFEIYNSYTKKNILYNNHLYQKIILLSGNTIAFSYSIKINNHSLIFNYGSLFGLDIIVLIIHVYYFYKNKKYNLPNITHNIENQTNPIHNSVNEPYSEYSVCYV